MGSGALDIPSYSPADGSIHAWLAESTGTDVTAGVALAASAAASVASTAVSQRSRWLESIARGLRTSRDELIDTAQRETALGEERLIGELDRAAELLEFYGAVAREGSFIGLQIDDATDQAPRLVRVNRPLGPVAVFGASNFPFAFGISGTDTASALAAGCPVVAKAHPAHPMLSEQIARVAVESLAAAGAPDGTFGIVRGFEAGEQLVDDPAVAAVAFTGSQAGGLAIWRRANNRPVAIPVFAEMGTVNPVVVTPSARHIDQIAHDFVDSFTASSGQQCTKPGLLLAPRGRAAFEAVERALSSRDLMPTMLTSRIAHEVSSGIGELQRAGARVRFRSDYDIVGWGAPAALLEVPLDRLVHGSRLLEECFGAVALVAEYDDLSDVLGVLDQLQGALVASVMTGGDGDADGRAIVARLTSKVGRVVVGGMTTGVGTRWAQQHGGPWPATTVPSSTSLGAAALTRFVRPVAYQDVPDGWLPPEARASNEWTVPCRHNGALVRAEEWGS